MTNGEKLKEIFPNGLFLFKGNWLNEEYKAPTTKNDLVVDCISRRAVIDEMEKRHAEGDCITKGFIKNLPSVTPQEPRKGEWLRMSDLSEQEDYRYKCSRCGNVIHHKSKMDLYTFSSWCGRCGSDNGRKIEVTV